MRFPLTYRGATLYHYSFMSGRVPESINPFQLIESHGVIDDRYAVSSLPRVKAAVFDARGEFAVRLEFSRDAAGRAIIAGHLAGTVTLQCQRCLEAMTMDLEIRPHLGLCRSEAEAARLPEELEPLMVGDGALNVREVVEDEILLALPIVARHARRCMQMPVAGSESPADEETRRPFRDLRKLLDEGQ